jgi:hypothetical protein
MTCYCNRENRWAVTMFSERWIVICNYRPSEGRMRSSAQIKSGKWLRQADVTTFLLATWCSFIGLIFVANSKIYVITHIVTNINSPRHTILFCCVNTARHRRPAGRNNKQYNGRNKRWPIRTWPPRLSLSLSGARVQTRKQVEDLSR